MIRRLGWLFAAAVAIGGAQDAPPRQAEVSRPVQRLSRAEPDWLTIGAQYRFRFESRDTQRYERGNDDAYGLNRVLIDVGVKPKPWLDFHFQGQDARAPGKKNATPIFRDPFDVRQAWVQFGDSEDGWVRLRAGRQELLYGAQRLVGPLDWLNTARQFDAVKVNIGRKGLNLDLFAASVVVVDDRAFNKSRDGNNLHGAYARLDRLVSKGSLDVYTFWKTTPRVVGERGAGDADLYTTGFRFTRPLAGRFDVETEMARQYGSFGADDIEAWGGYWILGYSPPGMSWSPRFSVEYQYGSGDDDPADGKRGTFDQLFPTGHLYQGTADQIGWRNVQNVRAGVTFKPLAKTSITFDYFSFWLAARRDNLYAVNGAVSVRAPEGGAQSKHIGEEVDAILTWKPAAHATVGAGVGYFFTGNFLTETTPGRRHVFTYLFLNYVL